MSISTCPGYLDSPGRLEQFQQPRHLQYQVHCRPALKHSQYFFWHLDFLHWQWTLLRLWPDFCLFSSSISCTCCQLFLQSRHEHSAEQYPLVEQHSQQDLRHQLFLQLHPPFFLVDRSMNLTLSAAGERLAESLSRVPSELGVLWAELSSQQLSRCCDSISSRSRQGGLAQSQAESINSISSPHLLKLHMEGSCSYDRLSQCSYPDMKRCPVYKIKWQRQQAPYLYTEGGKKYTSSSQRVSDWLLEAAG